MVGRSAVFTMIYLKTVILQRQAVYKKIDQTDFIIRINGII